MPHIDWKCKFEIFICNVSYNVMIWNKMYTKTLYTLFKYISWNFLFWNTYDKYSYMLKYPISMWRMLSESASVFSLEKIIIAVWVLVCGNRELSIYALLRNELHWVLNIFNLYCWNCNSWKHFALQTFTKCTVKNIIIKILFLF